MSRAVFLSYASQDAEAARRLAEALRAAGVEVWFDQNELVGGDAWDQKIRRQIRECALLIPMISKTTQSRREAYFRLEWNLAEERTHLMAKGTPFLLPVTIDETRDQDALVPDAFLAVQWTKAPDGEVPAAFCARVKRLLAGEPVGAALRRDGTAESRREAAPAAGPRRPRWRWSLMAAFLGLVIVFLGYAFRHATDRSSDGKTPQNPPAPATAPGVLPEGRQLAQKTDALAARPEVTAEQLAASLREQKSVAVLAFANLSEDKTNEYFSDGISEELLNVLAKVPGLKVTARTSAFYFKGKDAPIPEIAQKLGVAYVVEGSVRKSGDKVRITAQLIKAADGFHVWSDTFTRDLKDIFAVQDEIAGLIAQTLQLKIGAPEPSRREVNPEVHRLVLEARHFWNRRTMEGFARAETAARQAIALDPDFATAHAMLAIVLTTRSIYRGYEGVPDDSIPAARQSAERAITLDAGSVEAQAALGIAAFVDGHSDEADRIFQRAIALNPSVALPHHWYSLVLESTGRLDGALREIDRAIELDPLSGIAVSTRGRYLAAAGRAQEALAAFARAAPLLPDRPTLHGIPACCLLQLGRREDAVTEARKIAALAVKELRLTNDADAIWILRQTGHETEAGEFAERILPQFTPDSYQRGAVLAVLGRWGEAEPFLAQTPREMRYMYFWSPIWDSWREDPRFARLLDKMGCAQEYRVARETLSRMRRDVATR